MGRSLRRPEARLPQGRAVLLLSRLGGSRRAALGLCERLPFTPQVLEACYNATNEVFASLNEKNPGFKKVFESWKPFRAEEVLWFRVAENTLDDFMARPSAANKL